MPVGAAILSEFQGDENVMWGEVRSSGLKVKPRFQVQLIYEIFYQLRYFV